ncbi:YusW family protein [Salisediminibacterium beveridgei]|uniref:YusW-like protein n=1 Tax=Salisediminibacterium beveridgei TaxID=632773 RepID=A0A1D7QXN1_9BACI|nr:YusW family protein [Salisediminibacterium beveridgei]AOM83773.1 hypothetical protein BBEV_2433 [Salisediminibacterium beveridgei]
MKKSAVLLSVLLFAGACNPDTSDDSDTDRDRNLSSSQIQEQDPEDDNNDFDEEEAPGHQGIELRLIDAFHLDINLTEGQTWAFDYHQDAPNHTQVKSPDNTTYTASDAVKEVEGLVTRISVSRRHSAESIIDAITDALNTDSSSLEDMTFSLEMSNGEQYAFATQKFQKDQDPDSMDSFSLELGFYSGESFEITYNRSNGTAFIVPVEGPAESGSETASELDDYLNDLDISYDDSFQKLQETVLDPLGFHQNDVEKMLLAIEFDNEDTFEFQHVY